MNLIWFLLFNLMQALFLSQAWLNGLLFLLTVLIETTDIVTLKKKKSLEFFF